MQLQTFLQGAGFRSPAVEENRVNSNLLQFCLFKISKKICYSFVYLGFFKAYSFSCHNKDDFHIGNRQ